MKNVIADLKIYARNYLRSPSAVFFVFIFPMILMLVFGSVFSGTGSSTTPLYVQNADTNGNMSAEFVSLLNSTHIVDVKMIPAGVNIQTYISDHSVSAALYIPPDFTSSLLSGKETNLTYYSDPAASTSIVDQQAINFVVQKFNDNFSSSRTLLSIESTTVSTHAVNYVDYLIPGLIGFVVLISPMFSVTYVVSTYKKDKIFRQLSLTPLTKSEWFLSKVLWYLFISAISAIIIIAIGKFLFNSSFTPTLLMIPFLLIGVFMFTCLGTLSGAVSKSEESASVIGNVITFPMMFLSGTFFQISIMPIWLQNVAHVLPLYYIIDGINSVTIYSNYSSAVIDLIVSSAVTIAIFVLMLFEFSWKEERTVG